MAAASKLNYNVYMSYNYCFLKYSPSLGNAEHFTKTQGLSFILWREDSGALFLPSQEGIKRVEVNHF